MFKQLHLGFLSLSIIFAISSIHFGIIALSASILFSLVGCFILWLEKAYFRPVENKSDLQKLQEEIDLERTKTVLEELKHQIFMNKAKRDSQAMNSNQKESKYIF